MATHAGTPGPTGSGSDERVPCWLTPEELIELWLLVRDKRSVVWAGVIAPTRWDPVWERVEAEARRLDGLAHRLYVAVHARPLGEKAPT